MNVPQVGSNVWFKKPRAVPRGRVSDWISENRQRSFILTHGFGPFRVEEVRNGSPGGIVVVIRTLAGVKEVPAARLMTELPTTFKPGQRVSWTDSQALDEEAAGKLATYKSQYPAGPFTVAGAIPAHPYDPGSDLVEIAADGRRQTVESRFLVPA
ncbi:hypothetical protein C4571_00900 [Candidatus Parcubacteria bacterium]|nr:MAG: hypothetical protein C4571_00900 [Candidatus Parcubacteria bacterium]